MPGDELVLQAGEEDRAARIPLAPGPPPQLVVEPAAAVPAGADHVQPAEHGDLAVVARRAAEPDVGPPARHLGGDGDGAAGAGLGHDRGFLGVVLGVEDDAAQALAGQALGDALGLGHVQGADQDRPALACTAAAWSASAFSFWVWVAYRRSGWSARTHGRFGGITPMSSS